MHLWVLAEGRGAAGSPGAVDTGVCESPIVGAGKESISSGRAESTLKHDPYLQPQT